MMKFVAKNAVALCLLFSPQAHAQDVDLDALAGEYAIHDPEGKAIGRATISVREPNNVIEELRQIDSKEPQRIWFVFLEHNAGWTQLFVSPSGVREFPRITATGQWPIKFGSRVTLANGDSVDFRLTIELTGHASHHRLLEVSRDEGNSWSTMLDYDYRALNQ